MDVVNLDQSYSCAAVFPGQNGSELADGHRYKDCCFLRIGESETVGAKLGRLVWIILPIVVRGDNTTVIVMELQGRIGQDRIEAKLGQRWSNPSDYYPCGSTAADDESSDHDVVIRQNKATRADVTQLRIDRLAEVIEFDETYAGPAVLPGQDGGELSR